MVHVVPHMQQKPMCTSTVDRPRSSFACKVPDAADASRQQARLGCPHSLLMASSLTALLFPIHAREMQTESIGPTGEASTMSNSARGGTKRKGSTLGEILHHPRLPDYLRKLYMELQASDSGRHSMNVRSAGDTLHLYRVCTMLQLPICNSLD